MDLKDYKVTFADHKGGKFNILVPTGFPTKVAYLRVHGLGKSRTLKVAVKTNLPNNQVYVKDFDFWKVRRGLSEEHSIESSNAGKFCLSLLFGTTDGRLLLCGAVFAIVWAGVRLSFWLGSYYPLIKLTSEQIAIAAFVGAGSGLLGAIFVTVQAIRGLFVQNLDQQKSG